MKALPTFLLLGWIALSMACGYSAKATTPLTAGSVPAISSLAPEAVTSGSGGFMLTVNGSNFSSNSVVNWNGAAQATTYLGANQLVAAISAADVATPATVPVTVTNPAIAGTGQYGSGGTTAETSNSIDFTIN